VVVDGQKLETTPFAHPIALAPGVHYVTLRHPRAPDQRRVIKILPGQTLTLDVVMAAREKPSDAGEASEVTEDAGPPTP
jgi:serine/threonine-protein kinase